MSYGWGSITAREICEAAGGRCVSGNSGAVVEGVGTDSRTVGQGELFWAIKGERFNGRDFARSALERGAAGVVLEENGSAGDKDVFRNVCRGFPDRVVIAVEETLTALGDFAAWWRQRHRVRVAAVTGSAGKTTTKEMAGAILERSGGTLRNRGNFNNLIGLPLTLLKLEAEHEMAVLEMGMNRPGEIGRLTRIADPDLGVITNVGMAHLEGVGDIRGVAKAKLEMVENISPAAEVVLNGDDPLLMEAARVFDRTLTTFGMSRNCDVSADGIEDLGTGGTLFHLHHKGGSFPVRLSVRGLQNVLNALAAASVGLSWDISPEDIAAGLEKFQGVPGRFRPRILKGDILLVDDTYNSNPLSLGIALDSLKTIGRKRRIIIALAEMMELGEMAAEEHFRAGMKAAELKPHRVLAMGEHAGDLVRGAVSCGMDPSHAFQVDNPARMAEIMIEDLKQGDLIFLKGSRAMALETVVEAISDGALQYVKG